MFEVRKAERNVPGLVLEREVRDLAGHRVRGIRLDERQEVEERALTEYGEQERRQREVGLVEERLQRRSTSRRRHAERTTAQRSAPCEDLDVARLVGDLNGEQLHDLTEVRVNTADEASRHDQRSL